MNEIFRKSLKVGFLFLLIIFVTQSYGQNAPTEKYKELKKEAFNLYKNKDFEKAATKYEDAFKLQKPGKIDNYYAARCWALTGKKQKAFKYLSKSIDQNFIDFNHLTTNKDFENLYKDKRWEKLKKQVKENEKETKIKYAPIVQSLKLVAENDQKYRKMLDSVYQKYGWQSIEFSSLNKKIQKSDSVNLKIVTGIIDKNGWLGQDEIGGEGADALFLVIQHADFKTQKKYLPIMRDAVANGKAIPQNLAMLEDRVLLGEGKMQIYGSQVETDKNTNKPVFSPIEDEMNVNIRRASVGLPPIEEYARMMGIDYKAAVINK